MARENAVDPGQRVVVWGAGEGMELALELARQGRSVRLIDQNPQVVPAPYLFSRMRHVLMWLEDAKVKVETGTVVREITPKGIKVAVGTEPEQEIECDSVIVCQGREAVPDLYHELEGKVPEVLLLGDAKKPRSYGNAIHEAAYLARQLG
jgi:NADH dehydrogenase FAD-containing subunit